MPAKKDLTGQRFGKLVVLEETEKRKNKSVVWKCQCDCGNFIELSTKELRSAGVLSCKECKVKRQPISGLTEDIIGKKFNRLTVIEKTDKTQSGKLLYLCKCDCGGEALVTRTDLIRGHTKSCGCQKRKYEVGDTVNNREIIECLGAKEDRRKGNYYYKCKCLLCGREYEALAQTLDNTVSCGCQRSLGEYYITRILINNNVSFQKEYVFPNSNYRFDFAIFDQNNNIIRLIEFDGEQHYADQTRKTGWNTIEKYNHTYQNDLAKNQLAKEKNIPLVRIPYWERETITYELLFSDKYLVN